MTAKETQSINRFFEPATHLEWWKDWAGIFLGSTILATGFVFFINPYNIVPGGVYGASIVLHNLFPTVQVGTFGYMFDIPLLILAVFLLGARLGARTIVASMITPAIMNGITALVYPNRQAMHILDPKLLLDGRFDLSDHLMLSCIIGAVMIGIGSGIVVRSKATTGGSDVIGMMIQKFVGIKFSHAILIVDGTVVLFGLIVIGLNLGSAKIHPGASWYLSLYSLISIYTISRVIGFVISGAKGDKIIFVISDKALMPLHQYILKDMDRTATLIKSSGLYTGQEKEMLFLVVTAREVADVKHRIKEADPRAFVIVTDAYDTYGEGWKHLPEKDEIQPE